MTRVSGVLVVHAGSWLVTTVTYSTEKLLKEGRLELGVDIFLRLEASHTLKHTYFQQLSVEYRYSRLS